MELTMRPAAFAERLYAYEQSDRIAGQCGCPGYLWAELDSTGAIFLNSWVTCTPSPNTPEFKAEFNTVLDMLRFDKRYGGILKNRTTMTIYCMNHAQEGVRNGYEYAFRADTRDYTYLIRCIPKGDDNHVYIYPYHRNYLDRHMKQAEKGIRFINLDDEEIFRIQDGDMVRIFNSAGNYSDRMARYIDDSHVEIGGSFYHIREFAEWIKTSGGRVIPLRSTLPDKCFSVATDADEMMIIVKGEMGGHIVCKKAGVTSREGADAENKVLGVTKAQEAAMLAGSMFGWNVPAADPKNYNEQGQPIRFKGHDHTTSSLGQALKIMGQHYFWKDMMPMADVLDYLRENGENYVALEPIRDKYEDQFGNELCWTYPFCFDDYLGCVILLVQEGALCLPYSSIDSETYEQVDLSAAELMTAEKVQQRLKTMHSCTEELQSVLSDIYQTLYDASQAVS